jgi:hypothetical protein
MASREGAFDFLTVLQKNHGAGEHYDRQGTSGSGGSRLEAQTSLGQKMMIFRGLRSPETLSAPGGFFWRAPTSRDSGEVGADSHGHRVGWNRA